MPGSTWVGHCGPPASAVGVPLWAAPAGPAGLWKAAYLEIGWPAVARQGYPNAVPGPTDGCLRGGREACHSGQSDGDRNWGLPRIKIAGQSSQEPYLGQEVGVDQRADHGVNVTGFISNNNVKVSSGLIPVLKNIRMSKDEDSWS